MALTTTTPLPTLYEYYTTGGISNGLSIDQSQFTLNNKNFSIYSGAMHYFRIPKQYWRDRLRKLRATGLNTIETYVPWNLHESQNGTYDFGNGGTDMQDFLDVGEFLTLAKDEDLFAIVRPGPYICGEWEFGGLPSWLLHDNDIKLRTSETKYMSYVRRYFSLLLPILAAFQFLNGGPVIAFQVENEYASTPYGTDKEYLRQLYEIYREYGVKELLLTSDNDYMAQAGTIPDLLFQTINFGATPTEKLNQLAEIQPGKPLMVMEYWDGWYDHWSEPHHTVSSQQFHDDYETILKYPASVNLYMFHGGTNFGFLNGANIDDNNGNYLPTITSYDYNAVLTEAGDYTEKYQHVKNLLDKYNTIKLSTPDVPELVSRVAYATTKIDSIIPYEGILEQANEIVSSPHPIPMELLPINNNSGQSYGYTVYRKENIDIEANAILTISGYLYDSVIVLINNQMITKPLSSNADLDNFGYWRLKDPSIILTNETTLQNATIDLLVENWGRINYGVKRYQYKGLQDSVLLNGEEINDWKIIPLEFKRKWNENINGWQTRFNYQGPALYRARFTVDDELKDTYVDMEEWVKGLVIVNGFPLGRYVKIGPQQSLYLPAPLLRVGVNEMVIFEQFQAPQNIKFTTDLIFKTA